MFVERRPQEERRDDELPAPIRCLCCATHLKDDRGIARRLMSFVASPLALLRVGRTSDDSFTRDRLLDGTRRLTHVGVWNIAFTTGC